MAAAARFTFKSEKCLVGPANISNRSADKSLNSDFALAREAMSFFVNIQVDFAIIEPPHGKTNNLHRQKQRRRSASQ